MWRLYAKRRLFRRRRAVCARIEKALAFAIETRGSLFTGVLDLMGLSLMQRGVDALKGGRKRGVSAIFNVLGNAVQTFIKKVFDFA
jgi:hypothetical protein